MTTTLIHEPMRWMVEGHVQKWDERTLITASQDLGQDLLVVSGDDLLNLGVDYDRLTEFEGNNLLNAGITRLLNLLVVAGGQGYDNTHARIGVGDSTTAFAATQTDLSASSNKFYQLMDATYPSVSAQTATFRSTFATGDANYAWQEWVIDPGTASNTTGVTPALNRRVVSLGTKASGSWTLTVTLTIS